MRWAASFLPEARQPGHAHSFLPRSVGCELSQGILAAAAQTGQVFSANLRIGPQLFCDWQVVEMLS